MKNETDLSFLDIASLIGAYRSGKLSPVDVVASVVERAHACRSTLNAFNEVADEAAMVQARLAEAAYRRGNSIGPLTGVPITVKDNIPTAGIRTTFGSLAFAANVPKIDAISVRRLRQGGAIIIGKTTTPEFACKQTTNSTLSGVTRNPWNLALTPGGSSGGSAASIAAGIGHLSLVTDGGGSARLPAACTGIVGLKPTFGAIPFDTALDVFGGLGHIGLMARSVRDVTAALAVTRGPDPSDPLSLADHTAPPWTETRSEPPLSGLRIGWRERLHDEAADPCLLQPFDNALRVFERLGATIHQIDGDIEPPLEIWRVLQHAIWAERYADNPDVMEHIDPVIAAGIRHAEALPARALQAACHGRTRLFRRVQHWLTSCDIMATPALARPPLPAEHPGAGRIEVAGRPAGDIREAWAPHLGLVTITGHPALSINCGWTLEGLPIGLHLVARWHQEALLLRTATALEDALPEAAWHLPGVSPRYARGD
jgi:aspartyl-tRNA(Asn)/glutamyl-tRNA(Gln) amidotransferase subunit A